jgi:hypothetical protein
MVTLNNIITMIDKKYMIAIAWHFGGFRFRATGSCLAFSARGKAQNWRD